MFILGLVFVGVNNEDSHVRTRPLPLAVGLPLSPWIEAEDGWEIVT
jgi:hypothetical protein